ncbi:MAG: type I secretion system permease/ATPase [Burkholderiaceae bacterium]
MTKTPPQLLEGLSKLSQARGRPVSVVAMQAQLTFDGHGAVNMASLRAAVSGSGLVLGRHDGSLLGLRPDQLPALAACGDGSFKLVSDPAQLQDDDLPGGYGGYCLTLTLLPDPDRRSELPARRSARAWFWQVLWRLRPFYLHVALATLVVNLLSIAVSLYVMNVYDRVVPNRTYETLWVLTIGTLIALAFDFCARMLRGWLIDTAGKRADIEISSNLFQRMLSMQFISKPVSSGSFVNNLRDFEAIREVLTSASLTALIDLPFFLLFVGVIALIAPPLAVIPISAAVLVVIAGLIVQRPLARHILDMMKEGSQRQGLAVETVEGLETLKVNNALGHAQQRWEWFTASVAVASNKSRNLSNFVINATSLIQQMVTVATVTVGVYLIHAGQLSMGGLIGIVILCGRAIAPLAQVAGLAVRVQQARAAFSGLQAMMDKPLERDDDRAYLSVPRPQGAIALSNVTFKHDPQGPDLFRDFSLRFGPGERVAILGRTGSGKSTLLRLGAGLYSPSAGLVSLDGIDMRQIDPAELRASVALVPQDARLFMGTLRENLDIARIDRRGDDEQLVNVLKQFGLAQMIARHPRGLDMQLGEDGMGLSGGQKRLVALARLALRDPTVALLDEPTSGLDPSTERSILNTLREWSETPNASGTRRALIVVTHRPQVLEIVDRVLVMEGGRIVVDGPRAEVMEKLAKGITISIDGGGA